MTSATPIDDFQNYYFSIREIVDHKFSSQVISVNKKFQLIRLCRLKETSSVLFSAIRELVSFSPKFPPAPVEKNSEAVANNFFVRNRLGLMIFLRVREETFWRRFCV